MSACRDTGNRSRTSTRAGAWRRLLTVIVHRSTAPRVLPKRALCTVRSTSSRSTTTRSSTPRASSMSAPGAVCGSAVVPTNASSTNVDTGPASNT